jgi:hypothetical protein
MSAEYMNHATTGACFALELYAVTRWTSTRKETLRRRDLLVLGALAGLAAGLTFMTRPLTFVALQAAFGAYLLQRAWAGRSRAVALGAVPAVVVAGALVAAQLWFNARLNGRPLTFAYSIAYPDMHLGFGRSMFGVHTPLRAVENTLRLLDASNLYLLGLPLPAVLLAAVGFVRRREAPIAWLVAGAFLVQLVAHTLFPSMDLTFGPRYVYEPCLGLIPLALAGLEPVTRLALGPAAGDAGASRRAWALAAVLAAVSILPGLGVYYRSMYALDGGLVDRARATLPPNSVVLIESNYQKVFHAVDPELRGPMLFARDLGPRNAELACGMRPRPAFLERAGAFVPYEPDCRDAPPPR